MIVQKLQLSLVFPGLAPTQYPLAERNPLNQLVEYYFNLTRFALATGKAIIDEEQKAVKLQPSFYQELRAVKTLLHKGTVNIRKVVSPFE